MRGPEELLASRVMRLAAYPVLLTGEALQCNVSTIIVIVPTASANTLGTKPIRNAYAAFLMGIQNVKAWE